MMEDPLSPEENAELIRQFSEEKLSIPAFFGRVLETEDTTRVGNLNQDELGFPPLPLRSYKELSVFCTELLDNPEWGDYFNKMGEIVTSTSLSKDAILLKLLVTKKNEVADITPARKENKGWFKKKGDSPI